MPKKEPIFKNCNVCGRGLMRADEFAIGMCAVCANEYEDENPKQNNDGSDESGTG
jgi:hypothetical protein